MNQGPSGDCLMKKKQGSKSRDTVPLNDQQRHIEYYILTTKKMQQKNLLRYFA
jgi:hypothetical protein